MKRGKKMILLLGALGVLLGGYALIGEMNKTVTVSETKGSYPLWTQGQKVASLKWTQDGETLAFSMGESVWTKDGDTAFPVNQTVLSNLADRIENLTGVSELTDAAKKEDYGLDAPAFSVTVCDEAGSETVYAMGAQTPFADGYYLSVSGRENVYVIESSLAKTFDKTLSQLAQMETMPPITEVTRLSIGSALDASRESESGAWTETTTGERLDSAAVNELAEAAKNLAWSELIATGATDEELSAWALDDAQAVKLTLHGSGEEERALLLGGTDADGDRYARLADSNMVYTFYSGDADPLLDAGVDTLYMKTLPVLTVDQIGEITFAWEGGEKTLTGSDGDSTTMQSIVEHLNSFEGTQRTALGELDGVVLKVNVTDTDGAKREHTFHAYNVDSYLMPLTDTHGMLVPAQDVDKLIRMIKQIP